MDSEVVLDIETRKRASSVGVGPRDAASRPGWITQKEVRISKPANRSSNVYEPRMVSGLFRLLTCRRRISTPNLMLCRPLNQDALSIIW